SSYLQLLILRLTKIQTVLLKDGSSCKQHSRPFCNHRAERAPERWIANAGHISTLTQPNHPPTPSLSATSARSPSTSRPGDRWLPATLMRSPSMMTARSRKSTPMVTDRGTFSLCMYEYVWKGLVKPPC
uniref:Uncharacterized protein n=1 Tax=Coturnix japonica TaxID=93934 RepID=A0A8C2Y528_COTJA